MYIDYEFILYLNPFCYNNLYEIYLDIQSTVSNWSAQWPFQCQMTNK